MNPRPNDFVTRAFDRWIERQDPETIREITAPKLWALILVVCTPVQLALSYAPGVGTVVRLSQPWGVLAMATAFGATGALGARIRKRPTYSRTDWLLVLFSSAAQYAALAALVPLSSRAAAPIMIVPLMLLLAGQGWILRSSVNAPFLMIAAIPAVAGSIAWSRYPEHRISVFVGGFSGILCALILGRVSARTETAAREREQLRAAIAAQILDEEHSNVLQLRKRLDAILGAYHDMGNTLMTAMMAAESMRGLTEQASAVDAAKVREISDDIESALSDVRTMLGEMRSARRTAHEPVHRRVDVLAVVEDVRARVAARWPAVHIDVRSTASLPVSVSFRGGDANLRRVIENLLVNACEGNGAVRARTVDVLVSRDASTGDVRIRVSDDGPGFVPEWLESPIAGFATTKRSGTGLGLYTSERLVLASGGTLRRSNREQGGAQVDLSLSATRELASLPPAHEGAADP